MDISQSEKKQFQKRILDRYASNKRDLPWRETTDPYKIMVSEIMLQQTQVPRVITKFNEWMQMRPTVYDLANASRADVLRAWSGLGFNRRAINLHEACKQIASAITNYELQVVMSDYTYLKSLP
jgi:A/G-specific adenine glycosylase